MDDIVESLLPWLLALVGAAIINAVIRGRKLLTPGVLSVQKKPNSAWGLFLLIAAIACLSMTLLPAKIGYPVEVFATFVAGPALLWIVLLSCKTPTPGYWLAGACLGAASLLLLLPTHSWLNASVFSQWAFTLCAWGVYVHSMLLTDKKVGVYMLLLLLVMTLMHGLQLLRIFTLSEVTLMTLLVPFGLALMLLFGTHYVARIDQGWPVRRRSRAIDDKQSQVVAQLTSQVIEGQLFLDPELTLQGISEAIQQPPHLISNTINGHFDCRVDQFIAKLRLEYAKGILSQPEEHKTSIEAVALMSGFKSRSVFYTAFNKQVGCTPAQYRAKSSSSSVADK